MSIPRAILFFGLVLLGWVTLLILLPIWLPWELYKSRHAKDFVRKETFDFSEKPKDLPGKCCYYPARLASPVLRVAIMLACGGGIM